MSFSSDLRAFSDESEVNEASYLYGRDPTIVSCNRPHAILEAKKNLMPLLEENSPHDDKTSISSEAPCRTVKVFLRMKPFPIKMKMTAQQEEAYQILNSTTLLTKLPCLDNNTSCLKKIKMVDNTVSRKFMFTKTFGPETSQLELFEQAVKPQMTEFLSGKNSIVMTYGKEKPLLIS